MSKGIWVIAEQQGGKVRNVSLEIISESKKIGAQLKEEVVAVLVGDKVEELADSVTAYGADKVIVIENDKLASYTTAAYTKVLTEVIKDRKPALVLFGNTIKAKDMAPRIAMRLGVGLATDCIDMKLDNEQISFTRPIYAGKAYAKVVAREVNPVMATIRPNSFAKEETDQAKAAVVERIAVSIDTDLNTIIRETVKSTIDRLELTEASIIVSGGRGVKGPEGFQIIEELADVLGAAVGASRAAVDSGWREHQDQVGQTGKVVSPILYIACGISGAIQHVAGMGSSKCIVAINKDPEATIFKIADYGIVGDFFEIVPLLKEEFAKELK